MRLSKVVKEQDVPLFVVSFEVTKQQSHYRQEVTSCEVKQIKTRRASQRQSDIALPGCRADIVRRSGTVQALSQPTRVPQLATRTARPGVFRRRLLDHGHGDVLLLSGGRRVNHINFLQNDPMIGRLCDLERVPSTRTVGRFLARFDPRRLEALQAVNARLFADVLRGSDVRTLTIDVDGSVVSTGLKVQGAARGYNPHRRKVPSYYPITAYGAELGQVIRVENRPGNIHDGQASLGMLTRLFNQLRNETDDGLRVRFRMDSAFFHREVLDVMDAEDAGFAVKVPFWQHLGLKEQVAERQRWRRIDPELSYFETTLNIDPWRRSVSAFIFRRRVGHRTTKNYQLDLFDPDNGHYEYSAIATNLALSGKALWHFMCGRGAHEQAYGELKNGFGFDCVPSMQHEANAAWQILSVLAFNLSRAFQAATTATRRSPNGKGTCHYRFENIRTLRFKLLNRAGLITRPGGKTTLDVGRTPQVVKSFEQVRRKLEIAA